VLFVVIAAYSEGAIWLLKKKVIENELMKEIVSIRFDALWKMLSQKKAGFFPEPDEEGATGKLDNKGAIFIPGGFFSKAARHIYTFREAAFRRKKRIKNAICRLRMY
jgi:hypothetical protein